MKPAPATGLDWDDIRLFLSLHRSRSITAAARALGLNLSTVSRRLAGMERALGARLFDRLPAGLEPTALAAALLVDAETAEAAAARFSALAANADTRARGVVRVAVPDPVDSMVLAARLPAFHEQHPEIVLEIVASPTVARLTRREADIALRFVRPDAEDLVCARVGWMSSGVWGTASRVVEPDAPWITAIDELDPREAAWVRANVPESRVALRVNRLEARLAAAKAGVGLAILPNRLAEQHQELALAPIQPGLQCDVWLVTHPALRSLPRIRAVWALLAEAARDACDLEVAPRGP
jgi:DNA-binding transcriptional LysR family regulator